jgi:hypothetical protein
MGFLSLIVRLGADTSGFSAGMRSASVEADGLGKKIEGSIKRYLSVAAALAAMKGALDLADEIKGVANRLEVSAESAQQFRDSAKRANEELALIGTGMDKLGDKIQEAFSDPAKMKKFSELMRVFGLTMEDLKSKNLEEVFRSILASMTEGSSDLQKLGAGIEVFGVKAYGRLVNVAKELKDVQSGGLLSLNETDIEALDQVGDEMEGLGTKLKVLVGKAMVGLRIAPFAAASILAGDMDFIDNALPEADGGKQENLKKQQEAIKKALELKKADAAQQKEIDTQAQAHMATMDRVNALEKEAKDIGEQARKKALTEEQRRNELLERRAKILAHLNSQPGEVSAFMAEANARLKKELAQIDLDLAGDSSKGAGGGIQQAEGAARQGLFLGSRNDPLVDINRQQLTVLRNIDKQISKLQPATDVNTYFTR